MDSTSTFAIPALIVQGNMSYPQWTYDELAFPSIDLSSQTTGIKNATSGTITLNTPDEILVDAAAVATTIGDRDVVSYAASTVVTIVSFSCHVHVGRLRYDSTVDGSTSCWCV